VTTNPWRKDPQGAWVKAEDAIKRESELLDRIRTLEEQADVAASLVSTAMEIVSPSKDDREPRPGDER
jgi:hypothetical protein